MEISGVTPPVSEDRLAPVSPSAAKKLKKNPRFRGTLTRGDQTYAIFSEKPTDNDLKPLREVK